MNDLIFVGKLFALTFVLVLLMQIQVGDRTIENHTMSFVQTSSITAPFNTVAHGGAKMARDLSDSIHAAISRNTTGKKKKEEAKKTSAFRWFHRSSSETEQSSESTESN